MPSLAKKEIIEDFLAGYGWALSQGDLAGVVRSWDVPAFVLSDQGARLVMASTEIEEFFERAAAWYHEQGLAETRPAQVEIEALGESIFSVDVRWVALDAAGAGRSSERSRYILLIADDGQPRIRVAISIQMRE